MRLLCAFVLVAFLCVLPLALGGDRAAAVLACGMFEGKFECRAAPGGAAHGKNATPGVENESPDEPPPQGPAGGDWQSTTTPQSDANSANAAGQATPGEHSCPPGYKVLAVPTKSGYCEAPGGSADATTGTCQHGMIGTPPNNCHCPKSSELLGGNCVHYTATCNNGLPADHIPQPCQGADEKLACKTRQDGLKDCCCLTYDKL